jgi:hypothetical protein
MARDASMSRGQNRGRIHSSLAELSLYQQTVRCRFGLLLRTAVLPDKPIYQVRPIDISVFNLDELTQHAQFSTGGQSGRI